MAQLYAFRSAWIGMLGLLLLTAGEGVAGGHDKDPVFLFVSDELVLDEESVEDLCMAEGESGTWYLEITLKPGAGKRLSAQMASHIDGWFMLVAGGEVIFRSRILEPLSGKLPLILVSRESKSELEDLVRQTFGFAAPGICPQQEIRYP